ncbi:MAG: ribonuclease domain-containing protein [Dehalogenimonas sp.]
MKHHNLKPSSLRFWIVLIPFGIFCGLISFLGCALEPTNSTGSEQTQNIITYSDLPQEARTTLQLIETGGPFPFPQDGTVFNNFEGLLPKKTSGYYHEYTVITPGSNDRGARRIITGLSGERYYTDDHYASFKLVVS